MKPSSVVTVLVLVLVLAAPAFGATVAEERISIGWQSEQADVVVIGEVRTVAALNEKLETKRVTIDVTERLKGRDDLPGTLEVLWAGDLRVETGKSGLFFLDSRGRPVIGAHSGVPAPSESATSYVKTRIASMAKGTAGAGLRPEVLDGIDSKDATVALAAALDFGRIEGISKDITDAETDRIVAAFGKSRRADRRRRALVVALGATESKRAVAPLVAAVVSGRGSTNRARIGRALARIGDESAVEALTDGLKSERAATRADTVNVLGRTGFDDAAPVVVKALADPAGEVRIEAALAVGEIARTLRGRKEDAPEAHEALGTAYANATDARERKAALWAAAQLDTQAGYDVVRKAAASDTDRGVREFAARTLSNPRRRPVL